MMKDWNSNQYTKFEKERTQPSVDLISRIPFSPKSILDIGCGPGNSTNQLCKHFPKAEVLGIDNSDNMLDKARSTYPQLTFSQCTIPDDLDSIGSFDLIFSNACLHWIPNHHSLFPKLMEKLNVGGMLAVQMPLVQKAPFYKLLDQLIATNKWNALQSVRIFHNLSPNETYDILSRTSGEVIMWETTYYHVVPSHASIIDWYKGSGLRPYLERLTGAEQAEFQAELLERLTADFPIQSDHSVILKMPRLFFTARKE